MDLAQNLILPGLSGTPIQIQGPTQLTARFGPNFTIGTLITNILPLVLSFAGLILFGMLIWGGYDLLFSGGDPNKAASAKGKVTAAIIGFVIVFIAFFLTQTINYIFGLT